jgi:hypothetical protein
MTLFYDRGTIKGGKATITPEGYFVADALIARANNIQNYRASELGLTDRDPNAIVRVFRPEKEVFAVDSLRTASRLPITLDHPPGMVDASNWSQFSKGESGEDVLRDGQYLRVPIRVTDAAAVRSVRTDRQEFSPGYNADVVLDAGEFEGAAYDAVVTNIRYNHLAACRTARGGPELRITDESPAAIGVQNMPKIVPVDVSNPDVAAQVVGNLVTARDTANTALADASAALTARDATIAERDAEIVGLRDQVTAAKPTPAALRDMAREYGQTVAAARALGATVTDAMDVPAIHKAVVDAKMGATAANYTPELYAASFATLAKLANVADASVDDAGDPMRDAFSGGPPASLGDGNAAFADARAKRLARFANGHRAALAN